MEEKQNVNLTLLSLRIAKQNQLTWFLNSVILKHTVNGITKKNLKSLSEAGLPVKSFKTYQFLCSFHLFINVLWQEPQNSLLFRCSILTKTTGE